MNKKYNYEDFCKHYELDKRKEESKEEYRAYCEKLDFVKSLMGKAK